MRKSIFLGIFLVNIHLLPAQKLVPADFSYRSMIVENTDSTVNNMRSNVVTEIILPTVSTVWLGTGLGVSVIRDSLTVDTLPDTTVEVEFPSHAYTNGLPQGGISAMAVTGQGRKMFIAVAGSDENDIPVGKGVAFTENATDPDIDWKYYNQPIDTEDSVLPPFGRLGYIEALPITVEQANVTYDIAFSDLCCDGSEIITFAFIASWAGGLRRYKPADATWVRIPVPEDDQFELITCADTSYENNSDGLRVLKDFYYNPRDPIDGGNHNHKTFSVLVYGDTIWVGTANGINRGIINPNVNTNYCINWEHYSYPTHWKYPMNLNLDQSGLD